ncbi:MAG TPA: hypothetical protein VGM98_08670 [Schlesneria sp.]
MLEVADCLPTSTRAQSTPDTVWTLSTSGEGRWSRGQITYNALPGFSVGSGTPASGAFRTRLSGFVALLPYIDQAPLYAQIWNDVQAGTLIRISGNQGMAFGA